MPKIHCTLPNVTSPINGIEFEPHKKGGLISVEELPSDRLDYFSSVPGYSVVDVPSRQQRQARGRADAPPPVTGDADAPPPAEGGNAAPAEGSDEQKADAEGGEGESKE